MGNLRNMLRSWRFGKLFVDARRVAPVVALLGLLGPAAGCGGPGSTSVVLFDEAQAKVSKDQARNVWSALCMRDSVRRKPGQVVSLRRGREGHSPG